MLWWRSYHERGKDHNQRRKIRGHVRARVCVYEDFYVRGWVHLELG